MDTSVSKMIKGAMGKGEKMAPVKSIKLKVKFQSAKDKALKSRIKDEK